MRKEQPTCLLPGTPGNNCTVHGLYIIGEPKKVSYLDPSQQRAKISLEVMLDSFQQGQTAVDTTAQMVSRNAMADFYVGGNWV